MHEDENRVGAVVAHNRVRVVRQMGGADLGAAFFAWRSG